MAAWLDNTDMAIAMLIQEAIAAKISELSMLM